MSNEIKFIQLSDGQLINLMHIRRVVPIGTDPNDCGAEIYWVGVQGVPTKVHSKDHNTIRDAIQKLGML